MKLEEQAHGTIASCEHSHLDDKWPPAVPVAVTPSVAVIVISPRVPLPPRRAAAAAAAAVAAAIHSRRATVLLPARRLGSRASASSALLNQLLYELVSSSSATASLSAAVDAQLADGNTQIKEKHSEAHWHSWKRRERQWCTSCSRRARSRVSSMVRPENSPPRDDTLGPPPLAVFAPAPPFGCAEKHIRVLSNQWQLGIAQATEHTTKHAMSARPPGWLMQRLL